MEIEGIEFQLSTLRDENKKPFAVILYESKDNEKGVDLELIKDSASCIFQSEGNHMVFIKESSGNYLNCPVTVSMDAEDETRFNATLTAEPSICSADFVEAVRDNAASIESTGQVLEFTRKR